MKAFHYFLTTLSHLLFVLNILLQAFTCTNHLTYDSFEKLRYLKVVLR
jgi:hypothetical protein